MITELNTEKQNTDSRLAELYADRENLNSDISSLRAKFVRKEIDLSELQAAENRLVALNGSIEGLEAASRDLAQEIATRTLQEERNGMLAQAKVKGQAAFDLYEQLSQKRAEVVTYLLDSGQVMYDLIKRLREAQSAFTAAAGPLYPTETGAPGFISATNPATFKPLGDELRDAGLPDEAYQIATSPAFTFPAPEFEHIFDWLERQVRNQDPPKVMASPRYGKTPVKIIAGEPQGNEPGSNRDLLPDSIVPQGAAA